MTFSKISSEIGAVLLFVLCLAFVNFSFGEQKMCGSGLRNAMELMCPMGYNSYKTKRGSFSLGEDFDNENSDEEFNFGLSLDMLPFLTFEQNLENSGLAKIRRRRHGVAHECCDKPCTKSEMLAYCKE